MESNKLCSKVRRDKCTTHSVFLRRSAKVKTRDVREYPVCQRAVEQYRRSNESYKSTRKFLLVCNLLIAYVH